MSFENAALDCQSNGGHLAEPPLNQNDLALFIDNLKTNRDLEADFGKYYS